MNGPGGLGRFLEGGPRYPFMYGGGPGGLPSLPYLLYL